MLGCAHNDHVEDIHMSGGVQMSICHFFVSRHGVFVGVFHAMSRKIVKGQVTADFCTRLCWLQVMERSPFEASTVIFDSAPLARSGLE